MSRARSRSRSRKAPALPDSGGLILTRKSGDYIVLELPHGGTVYVERRNDDQLRVLAPPDVKVLRGELAIATEQSSPPRHEGHQGRTQPQPERAA